MSCPDPTQAPNKAEMPGWVAMVVWDGRDYLLTEQQGTPGERLGAVTCDIVAINKRTRAVPPRPWPDGSSTAAAVGSPIHAHQGRDTACELVLDTPEWGWRVFRAADC